ncbi:class I SAM-dependent methyltransferase [soil metagenome]
MSSKPVEWRHFFAAQAETYLENKFATHTKEEVDFFLSLFALPKGAKILDVGCGVARHSVELAQRGYKMTGLDFSPEMLAAARKNAEGLDVEFIEADAKDFQLEPVFDAAICLCEGGVGLIERGEDAEAHDLAIFRNISASLKKGSPFLLTALNGYSIIRQMQDEHIRDGQFDPATMVANYEDQWDLPNGSQIVKVYERPFIAPEIVGMLRRAGFSVDGVLGGTAGHWHHRPISLDEVEAMFICRKI